MPAQDRLGRDEERSPALARDQSRQGGDDRPVRPGEPRPGDLTAKDRHLVTQHQDLCVLGDGVHAMDRQDLDDATDYAVEEAECHGTAGSRLGSCLVKLAIPLLDPSST
jgi:hypothetical protein